MEFTCYICKRKYEGAKSKDSYKYDCYCPKCRPIGKAKDKKDLEETPADDFIGLAAEIVIIAISDYRKAYKKYMKFKGSNGEAEFLYDVESLRRWFRSEDFIGMSVNLYGEKILKGIEEEVEKEFEKIVSKRD